MSGRTLGNELGSLRTETSCMPWSYNGSGSLAVIEESDLTGNLKMWL